MAKLSYTYPAGHAMRSMTLRVNVTGVRTWRFRLWVGTLVLQLAALCMGCGISFDGIDRRESS